MNDVGASNTQTLYKPRLDISTSSNEVELVLAGTWDIGTLEESIVLLKSIEDTIYKSRVHMVRCDVYKVDKIDSSAILYIILFLRSLVSQHKEYYIDGRKETLELFETIASKDIEVYQSKTVIPFVLNILSALGEWLENKVRFYTKMCGFFGYLLSQLSLSILSPRFFHITPIVYQMEHMGIRAIPIISLLSFLIGMVLSYMSAEPFRRFGATLYVINLLDITILRELGVLLTAIIMAGRTGAACTAEIGSMVNNEEIASMQVMGLNVMEYLVIPRVVALTIMLPLVTIVADACALVGGMLAAWFTLDIVPPTFWSVFKDVTQLKTLYLGLIKAPCFAFIITGVGCFYGLQSRGSADDIGKLTTDSVVQSLFLVIVCDALFAVLYSKLGL